GIEQVERHRSAAVLGGGRAVQPDHRVAVAVVEPGQPGQHPAGEVGDPAVDQVEAGPVDPGDAELDVRDVQEVQRAGRQRALVRCRGVPVTGDADDLDRAAGEPRPVQPGQRVPADDQAADTGRVAEYLVPADGDEIRPYQAEIQGVGRNVRGGVQEYLVA